MSSRRRTQRMRALAADLTSLTDQALGKLQALRSAEHLSTQPGDPVGECPMCGSDDYDVPWKPDGSEPDYADGVKTCQQCGEQWV